jgi:predicted RNA-binding Zn ribbon-like protein
MNAACLDLLNSEFRDFRGRWVRDELQQPQWLEQFLARWGLSVATPSNLTVLAALMALRAQLRRMVEALAHGQFSANDLAALNAILLKSPASRCVVWNGQEYCLELVPLKKDWDWIQAEIAASFADLVINHDLQRLKICANANCRWIFYDESKSRTRRYCSTDKCANLLKVRRFRARHRDNPSEALSRE